MYIPSLKSINRNWNEIGDFHFKKFGLVDFDKCRMDQTVKCPQTTGALPTELQGYAERCSEISLKDPYKRLTPIREEEPETVTLGLGAPQSHAKTKWVKLENEVGDLTAICYLSPKTAVVSGIRASKHF